VVLVINADTPLALCPLRQRMHRVRKQVFVDRLGWSLSVIDDQFEIDAFDGETATYLVCQERTTSAHLASVRLLPSLGPTLLGEVFSDLCAGDVPTGPQIAEISRLCATPGLPRDKEMRARHKLSTALIEYALTFGVQRYTCVINVNWLPTLLAPGWACSPLGEPMEHESGRLGAFAIDISAATLEAFLARWGGAYPVLELSQHQVSRKDITYAA